eukprot:2462878-Rhodomonas_salina.2
MSATFRISFLHGRAESEQGSCNYMRLCVTVVVKDRECGWLGGWVAGWLGGWVAEGRHLYSRSATSSGSSKGLFRIIVSICRQHCQYKFSHVVA